MVVIEMRQAAKDKAFDLLDEIKDLGRKKKMAICELEETLYDCFESSEDEDEESDSDYIPEEESDDVDYRNRKSYRYGRREMRKGMRYDDDEKIHHYMRMRRRDRMGRFV